MPAAPRATPARLTAAATTRLPGWVLVALAGAYLVAGLFGRDPWKNDDVAGVATMVAALHDGAWLWPRIGTLPSFDDGPLTAWVGAAALWLAGPWLGELTAARLPNLLWFGLTVWALWYGTMLLARRAEAQPLALPFGGEPSPRDYGRLLADAALLLLLASAGLLWRSHETSSAPAALACHALAYFALARALDRPLAGAVTLAGALAGAFLTRGVPALLPLLLALGLTLGLLAPLAWRARRAPVPRAGQRRMVGASVDASMGASVGASAGALLGALWLALALAAVLLALWWWQVRSLPESDALLAQWRLWHARQFGLPDWPSLARTVRDLPWFLWPTWPLALMALWRWRGWWRAPHLAIPTALAAGVVGMLAVTRTPGEPDFMLLALPSAALAALALPTLRRGAVNTLDWFALMCFSLTLATVWLGWVALHFGWPPKIAGNIARQTSGFEPVVSWLAALAALAVSGGWAWLVHWRVRRRPAVLWRGAVLLAGGLTATWLLLALLWLPAIDYARSYRTVSGELAAQLARVQGAGECLRGVGVGRGQRAALQVFDGIRLSLDLDCPLVLQQTTRRELRDGLAAYSTPGVTVLWQGARRADRTELLRLIRLKPHIEPEPEPEPTTP